MVSARRQLQIIRFAMLISIVFYFIIVSRIPSSTRSNPMIFRILVLIAFANFGALIFSRKFLVANPSEALRSQPEDSLALAKWKFGQVLTWALSESIALYGLVLHFLGFSTVQVVPFLLAGAFLIVIFPPSLA